MASKVPDKSYDPGRVEEKWYAYWEKKGYFRADENSSRPAYSIVIPPPNVTGVLHIGHALNNTLQDILIRFNLPGLAHPFKTVARVVWSSPTDTPQGLPAGMGVQFLDLESQEQGAVEQYVVELLLDRVLRNEAEKKD